MTFFDFAQNGLLIDVATAPTNALALGNGPLLSATLSFLSSRAKPRDLRFRGPFVEMFSTERSGVERSAESPSTIQPLNQPPGRGQQPLRMLGSPGLS